MKRKTWFTPIFIIVLCLLTSGCVNIEQEIFLEPDGSGDMVFYFSMPDIPIPEEMKKSAMAPPQNLQNLIDLLKQNFANDLPPTIKLKDAKQIQRNGANAYYLIMHFEKLDDINSILNRYGKDNANKQGQAQPLDSKAKSFWKIQQEKAGDQNVITQSFYVDMAEMLAAAKAPSEKAPSTVPSPKSETQGSVTPESTPKPSDKENTGGAPGAPKESNPFESVKDMLDEQTMNMLLSIFLKQRFVLHTPKKITATNADIVLNGNIAVWNATFAAFTGEKKPIEMKVSY
jgi:hypothetical protein